LPQGGQIGKKATFVITAKNSVITKLSKEIDAGPTCSMATPESFEIGRPSQRFRNCLVGCHSMLPHLAQTRQRVRQLPRFFMSVTKNQALDNCEHQL
jgi:hypothetical protein